MPTFCFSCPECGDSWDHPAMPDRRGRSCRSCGTPAREYRVEAADDRPMKHAPGTPPSSLSGRPAAPVPEGTRRAAPAARGGRRSGLHLLPPPTDDAPAPRPLTPELVEMLQVHPAAPCVSVLLPVVAGRQGEANARRLLAVVARRVGREAAPAEADALLGTVERLLGTAIDSAAAGSPAVAVYASPTTAIAVALPVAVPERVVVDETFATRDLVAALARQFRYRVLVVSAVHARLFDGLGRQLRERHNGFPVRTTAAPLRDPSARLGREPSRRRQARLERFVRRVDEALAPHLRSSPAPLFLVGSEPALAAFRGASRHRQAVAAAIRAPSTVGSDALHRLLAPSLDQLVATAQRDALVAVGAARGAGRLASGIREAWVCALDGRGELLVVEESFRCPARLGQLRRVVTLEVGDVEHPEVVDDLVDELIELVLAKGGRMVVVPDATLGHFGRLALTLRH